MSAGAAPPWSEPAQPGRYDEASESWRRYAGWSLLNSTSALPRSGRAQLWADNVAGARADLEATIATGLSWDFASFLAFGMKKPSGLDTYADILGELQGALGESGSPVT